MLVSSSVTAFALFAAIASMPVPGPSSAVAGVKAVPQAAVQSVSAPGQFATLRGVKAVPMASRELDAVKGAHFHFATPSQNTQNFGETGLQLVNKNNMDAWVDLGNGELVGPGYHGLCGAALNSPKMFIPGQSETTGVGGGC
jgi:hypothetical protein